MVAIPGFYEKLRLFARRFEVEDLASIDDTIVIARNGEDGCGVIAIGFVELIVIVSGFAEIIDDVAQVEEERDVGGIGFVEIAHHFIGD